MQVIQDRSQVGMQLLRHAVDNLQKTACLVEELKRCSSCQLAQKVLHFGRCCLERARVG